MRPAQNALADDIRAAGRHPGGYRIPPGGASCCRCSDSGNGGAYDNVVPVAVRNAADSCPHRPVYRSAVIGPHAGVLRAAGCCLRGVVANDALDVAALTLGVSSGGLGVNGGIDHKASTSQRQHNKKSQGDTQHKLDCFLLAAHPAPCALWHSPQQLSSVAREPRAGWCPSSAPRSTGCALTRSMTRLVEAMASDMIPADRPGHLKTPSLGSRPLRWVRTWQDRPGMSGATAGRPSSLRCRGGAGRRRR